MRYSSAMAEWITTSTSTPAWLARGDEDGPTETACLTVIWSAAEPHRVGEVAFIAAEGEPLVLGRGGPSGDGAERLRFLRRRAGTLQPTEPLGGDGISRTQCLLRATPFGIEIEQVGRCPMLIDGAKTTKGKIAPGQLLTLKDQLVLYCTRRQPQLLQRHYDPQRASEFGGPDAEGLVGESPAAWDLREQLAFCASSEKHVLLLGESGSGKELAARAVHRLSARGSRSLVSRNAATLPAGLVDAELFGNTQNYPNAGMPARPGLVGQADESTLFLDEFAELSPDLQSHLLRVLDAGGEYQRLGDARTQRSNFRLIAATNRDPAELRPDVLARFTLRIQLPGLRDRAEDVPLLLRHLLRQAAEANREVVARFFANTPTGPEPRLDPDLVEALVQHPFTHHVRELDALLWRAIAGSSREYVAFPSELRRELALARDSGGEHETRLETSSEPTRDELVACLKRNGGNVGQSARELGVRSRYALYRLIRKHAIVIER